MPKLANPAKQANRERSVYTVTIWDLTGNGAIAHQFTTLANRAEVEQIVTDWLKPIKDINQYTDAQMTRLWPYAVENKLMRTN